MPKPRCAYQPCYLVPCADQLSPLCYPHTMLHRARRGMGIFNEKHATENLMRAVRHFAQGWTIAANGKSGILYVLPFWETNGLRRN